MNALVEKVNAGPSIPFRLEAPSQIEVAQSESAAIFALIERAARDPAVDIDKMERLMRMQKETREYNAQLAYAAALSDAKAEMKPVVRNQSNAQTKSKYADLAAISDAIDPIITKHGFSLSYDEEDCPKPGHQRVVCFVFHNGGHMRRHHADVPIDGAGIKGNANMTATHAFGSTNSYGRRYVKVMIFDIATKDDNDGNRARADDLATISEDQIQKLRTFMEGIDADEIKFLEFMGFEKLEMIPAKQFQKGMNALRDYAVKKGIKS